MGIIIRKFGKQFEVTASLPDFVSYLHYDNHQPVVEDFNIRSLDGLMHNDISVGIRITSLGSEFSEKFILEIPEVGPGGTDEVIDLKLKPDLFSAITSNQLAEVEIEIRKLDESVGVFSESTELYPLNAWRRGQGSFRDAVLLAAFSQPNDPIIAQILTKARAIKQTLPDPSGGTYPPNTSGYQSDSLEVVAEARSIYEAIQAYEIEYSNPISNYNLAGQPIRTPSEIIRDKGATCLDTAMLMSSCLEAIGLHPAIILVPQHAFVGVWTASDRQQEVVVDLLDISGLVKSGHLVLIETTTLCRGDNQATFDDATAMKISWIDAQYTPDLEPGEPDVRQSLSILRARYAEKIHPLPSIEVNKSGHTTVVQTELPKMEFNFTGTTDAPRLSLRDDNSPTRVKIWKTSLLDMTFNNPLLNRNRRSGSSTRLIVPNGKLGQVEDLLQSPGAKLALIPLVMTDSKGQEQAFEIPRFGALPEKANQMATQALVINKAIGVGATRRQFSSALKKLASASRKSIQETGVNNLYITFGSLTWDKDPESPSSGTVTSPLFLLPITLTHLGRDNFEISLDDSGEPAPNETLALKLSEFQINVPLLSNPETDDAGFDIPGLIQHVREQVNVKHKKTSWIIDEDASIGTFDFSNFHLWKDLHDNWKALSEAPLVKHLIETDGTSPFIDPKAIDVDASSDELDAEVKKLPIASDETQVKAILKSLSGQSFIIQGPPGTGKSQTITNLLARNLQEGKRVLFMSEKPAALGVVKSRLDEIDLGDFILDLHDKGTKPASVRNQLLAALEAKPETDETGLETSTADYDTALRTLAKYPSRIHTIDEKFGESVYSTRERLLEIGQDSWIVLNRAFLSEMSKAKFEEFLNSMLDLPDAGQSAKTYETNVWSLSLLLDRDINLGKKLEIKELVLKLNDLLREVLRDARLKNILLATTSVESLNQFKGFGQLHVPNPSELMLARSTASAIQRAGVSKSLEKLKSDIESDPYFNVKLQELDTEVFASKLTTALDAKLFKGKKLTDLAEYLSGYLTKNVTKDDVASVFQAERTLLARAAALNAAAAETLGIADISEFNANNINTYAVLEGAISKLDALLSLTSNELNPLSSVINQALHEGIGQDLNVLGDFGEAIQTLFELLKVSDESAAKWRGNAVLGEKLASAVPAWVEQTLDDDPRDLTRWSRVIEILEPLFKLEQYEAIDQILSGRLSYNDAPKAIQRSYLSLLFAKLLDDNDLSNFESGSHDSRVKLLDQAVAKLKSYNRGHIASQVVQGRNFDASSNAGVTGALKAELSKQKRQMPVRKLLRQYWQTITQVTPIVAASPDSVARFLSIESAKFDLVVFDEASQIRVATAISALGRAPQAIIVGDSKQMPPTSLFGKSGDGADLEFVEDDVFGLNDQESILSMAEVSQIDSVMLSWHYRSQDEILIAFSNKYIYEGKLSSFPSPRIGTGTRADRKLRLEVHPEDLYVSSAKRSAADDQDLDSFEGKANTNLAEAKRVVAEIQKFVKGSPKAKPDKDAIPLSLGVITMNEQQRELIERLLDALNDDKIQRLRKHELYPQDYLFVRALERVQGDERDVILFSVGFGRTNPKGKLNMTFGPLVRANSHRRLNVAVTRARQEMVVFTSFTPDELVLSETSSSGMKLLKKFLEFAAPDGHISVSSSNGLSLRDRHREEIATALEEKGFRVVQNLGLSNFRVDIAIADPADPEKCILGIMLDGKGWKARSSTADRDLLPTLVLKGNMKWPAVERMWLPMWLRDRDGELARISHAVEVAVSERELRAKQEAEASVNIEDNSGEEPSENITGLISISDLMASAESQVETVESPASGKTSKATTLGVNIDEIQHLKILGDTMLVPDKTYIQYLQHPKIRELLLDIADQLTNIEGPVSGTRFVQFVAKCFGLTGVKSARAEEILASLPKEIHKRDEEGFIYPKNTAPYEFKDWYKQSPGFGRALSDISLVELSNAMATLCSKTAGMESSELAKQTSLAFGTGKLTKLADKRMFDAERLGIKRGILVVHDDIVMAANS